MTCYDWWEMLRPLFEVTLFGALLLGLLYLPIWGAVKTVNGVVRLWQYR